jgi:hypothetical protein
MPAFAGMTNITNSRASLKDYENMQLIDEPGGAG